MKHFSKVKKPTAQGMLRIGALILLSAALSGSVPATALASQTFTAANAETALQSFINTYYNSSNGLFYTSESNHLPLDLWTSAFIRQGLCAANANTGGEYRQLISDTYYGFENYFKAGNAPFTWTETVNGQQQTTTDNYWWGEGEINANDDYLWNINAAICAYQATDDTHMLTEAEREMRYILETQLDSTSGFGDFGLWHTWSARDYKDISTTGQVPYIAEELAQYFPTETIYNNALHQSYTYSQYASMTYNWVKSFIEPDGSLSNGIGSQYFDMSQNMINVGLFDQDAAALYQATGNSSYVHDGLKVTDWARNRLTIPYNGAQIFWPEWETFDYGAHYDLFVASDDQQNTVAKGIMERGIIEFMKATGQYFYMQWPQDNADTAWADRHLSDNLLYTNWQDPNTLPAGSLASGNYTGIDLMERLLQAENNPALQNTSFESQQVSTTAPLGWTNYDFGNSANDGTTYTEDKAAPYNARTGNYMLTQWSSHAYQTYESQHVTIPNGTWNLTAWVRSSDGQPASYMDIKDFGNGQDWTADMSHASGSTWTQISINNVPVTDGGATIGFYSNANAGQWVNIDDVQFSRTIGSMPTYTARNFSFEDDGVATNNPSNWTTYDFGNSANDGASYTESKSSPWQARTGNFMLTEWKATPYQIYTYQTVTGLSNGTYKLTAWARSNGGQPAAYMDIKDFGNGQDWTADMSQASPGSGAWVLVTISNIPVTNGQATIGFYSNANGGQWINVDDVNLARQS